MLDKDRTTVVKLATLGTLFLEWRDAKKNRDKLWQELQQLASEFQRSPTASSAGGSSKTMKPDGQA